MSTPPLPRRRAVQRGPGRPTAAVPAPLHGQTEWEIGGRTIYYPRTYAYSQVFNLTSQPALSVPVGKSPEGLPIGVQIVGRHFEDAWTVAVARSIEQALQAD